LLLVFRFLFVFLSAGPGRFREHVSPSSGLEDEVGVGGALRVLVARPALPVGVGRSRTLREGLHHLCGERKTVLCMTSSHNNNNNNKSR